jgi:hypothetical protein
VTARLLALVAVLLLVACTTAEASGGSTRNYLPLVPHGATPTASPSRRAPWAPAPIEDSAKSARPR